MDTNAFATQRATLTALMIHYTLFSPGTVSLFSLSRFVLLFWVSLSLLKYGAISWHLRNDMCCPIVIRAKQSHHALKLEPPRPMPHFIVQCLTLVIFSLTYTTNRKQTWI